MNCVLEMGFIHYIGILIIVLTPNLQAITVKIFFRFKLFAGWCPKVHSLFFEILYACWICDTCNVIFKWGFFKNTFESKSINKKA